MLQKPQAPVFFISSGSLINAILFSVSSHFGSEFIRNKWYRHFKWIKQNQWLKTIATGKKTNQHKFKLIDRCGINK